jgi:Mn-dependent DtxR family transcriptional regulator
VKKTSKSKRSKSPTKPGSSKREQVLARILAMIRSKPGIRPSEINRRLNVVQTDALRDALIRRGLVRKVKAGGVTHLYAK